MKRLLKKITELTLISLVAIGVMVPAKSLTHGYMFEDSYNAGVIAGELLEKGYTIEEAADLAIKQVYGEEYGFAGHDSSSNSNSNLYPYMDRECNQRTYLYRKGQKDHYL